MTVSVKDLSVGDELTSLEVALNRQDLVKYAGSSGDFNPIHFSDAIAQQVGLDGVLAHGMLTMGLAVQAVVAWIGDPTKIVDYQVRFTRPVWVPETGEAIITIGAKVHKIHEDDGTAEIMLDVQHADKAVLGKAIAVVRLDS